MGSDDIAFLRIGQGAHDRAALGGRRSAPLDRNGFRLSWM